MTVAEKVSEKININEILLKEEISKKEAVALAKEIERLEPVLKQLKKKLSSHIEMNGALEVEDGVWDFGVNKNTEYTPEALANLADYVQHIGKNPFEYLSITRTNLNKIGIPENMLEKVGIRVIEKVGKTVKKYKKEVK